MHTNLFTLTYSSWAANPALHHYIVIHTAELCHILWLLQPTQHEHQRPFIVIIEGRHPIFLAVIKSNNCVWPQTQGSLAWVLAIQDCAYIA